MTDEGAVRRCSMPDCPAWYDAIEVMDGRATAGGWRRWGSLDLRLCPDHSWLWTSDAGEDAPHLPTLVRDDDTAWVRCSCGWRLDTTPYTAGESGGRYVAHLAEEVAATDTATDPVRPTPEPVLP